MEAVFDDGGRNHGEVLIEHKTFSSNHNHDINKHTIIPHARMAWGSILAWVVVGPVLPSSLALFPDYLLYAAG